MVTHRIGYIIILVCTAGRQLPQEEMNELLEKYNESWQVTIKFVFKFVLNCLLLRQFPFASLQTVLLSAECAN